MTTVQLPKGILKNKNREIIYSTILHDRTGGDTSTNKVTSTNHVDDGKTVPEYLSDQSMLKFETFMNNIPDASGKRVHNDYSDDFSDDFSDDLSDDFNYQETETKKSSGIFKNISRKTIIIILVVTLVIFFIFVSILVFIVYRRTNVVKN
ncbi:hypothetical protein [Salmon gill poxvirus]